MEEPKSMNNNKGGEGKNEVKRSITETRTEIKKAIRGFPRVDSVEFVDGDTNTVTTIGKVHLSKLREPVAKSEQVYPLPKKNEDKDKDKKKENGSSGEKKTKKGAMDKPKEKLKEKKMKSKEQLNKDVEIVPPKNDSEKKMKSKESPAITTAMLKVHSYCWCDGHTKEIRKVVTKTIGYYQMAIDRENGLVTVKGWSMDMKALAESLKQQLNKEVEIVPLSTQKEDEKKEKSGDDHEEKDGGERKTGGEGGLDDEKTEKSSGVESMQGGVGDTHKPKLIGKVNPVSRRTTVERNKYKKVHKVSPLPEKEEDKNNKKERGGGREENKKKEAKVKTKEKNSKEVLVESLKQQLNKDVEIAPPKNDSEEKEKSGGEECGGEGKTGCESGRDADKESEKKEKSGCEKERSGGERKAGDGGGGEKVEHYQYPYYCYGHAPQMFSDENPNSCSIM